MAGAAGNKTLLIAGAVIVILVIVVAGYFLFAGGGEQPAEAPAQEEQPAAGQQQEQQQQEQGQQQEQQPAQEQEVKTVKIGILLPQSGALAVEGQNMIKAAEYAIKKVNKALEEQGAPIRFEVLKADSGTDPVKALEGAQTLGQQGVKVIIGTASSRALSAIIDYVNTQGIITISPSSTSPALAKDDYVFRVVGNDRGQGKALAFYVYNEGFDAVGIIVLNDPYGLGIAEAFKQNFTQLVGDENAVQMVVYDPNKQDLAPEVQQLANIIQEYKAAGKNPAVLIVAFETDGLNILNNAKEIQVLRETRWFSSESIRSSAFFEYPEEVKQFAVNVQFSGTFPATPKTEFSDQIKAELEAQGIALEGFVGYSFDAAMLAALAVIKAGPDATPDQLKQAILDVSKQYVGITGFKELDPATGDLKYQDYFIWYFTGDAFEDRMVFIAQTNEIVDIAEYPPVSGQGKITPLNFADYISQWLAGGMEPAIEVVALPVRDF